jgi:hypothetical protein
LRSQHTGDTSHARGCDQEFAGKLTTGKNFGVHGLRVNTSRAIAKKISVTIWVIAQTNFWEGSEGKPKSRGLKARRMRALSEQGVAELRPKGHGIIGPEQGNAGSTVAQVFNLCFLH